MKAKKIWNSKCIINIMYIPVICLFLMFIVYPLIKGVGISMTNWDGYSENFRYVGLDNYRKMFADRNFSLIVKISSGYDRTTGNGIYLVFYVPACRRCSK